MVRGAGGLTSVCGARRRWSRWSAQLGLPEELDRDADGERLRQVALRPETGGSPSPLMCDWSLGPGAFAGSQGWR
ncbi:hypothetical protein NDU88_006702 [Pleurodeles waltl]|uniref:Uncharacterized protein n=1 Tax=Pleurodeles waltl TaxID=8319 RepID=A0AAV7LTA9_PLEWA|nr:hypothetical protein NDU88_006702 [Pleurodeles waltl]